MGKLYYYPVSYYYYAVLIKNIANLCHVTIPMNTK